MNTEKIIAVKDIKKAFKVYLDHGNTLKEKIITRERGKYQKREVLKGISFDVKKGEAIGLIGKNGCGKSTTLKLLTRIIYPDSGSIQIKGKVSSLLELGAGFHPDMSGRENIYLNASIFGLTKKEIDQKVNDIISFSELEEFIENPVRTYSSGMYMRLAFSVAINVNADVLLIDEILGVGDVSFQKKCFERLQEIKAAGTTIVIVSHSLEQLERICDRCIWIQDGRIKEVGIPTIVNAHYYKAMEEVRLHKCKEEDIKEKQKNDKKIEDNEEIKENQKEEEKKDSQSNEVAEKTVSANIDIKLKKSENNEWMKNADFMDKSATRVGSYEAFFSDALLKNGNGKEELVFSFDDNMYITLIIESSLSIDDVNISISISRDDGVYCYGTNTKFDNCMNICVENEKKQISFEFEKIQLLPGKYFLNFGLYDKNFKEYDVIWNAKKFYVKDENPNGEIGLFKMKHKWSC